MAAGIIGDNHGGAAKEWLDLGARGRPRKIAPGSGLQLSSTRTHGGAANNYILMRPPSLAASGREAEHQAQDVDVDLGARQAKKEKRKETGNEGRQKPRAPCLQMLRHSFARAAEKA